MNKEDLSIGQKVHYTTNPAGMENGIVKEITDHAVFVVYNCAGNWDQYQNYTGANTNPRDLQPGWANREELVSHQRKFF